MNFMVPAMHNHETCVNLNIQLQMFFLTATDTCFPICLPGALSATVHKTIKFAFCFFALTLEPELQVMYHWRHCGKELEADCRQVVSFWDDKRNQEPLTYM